MAILDVEVRLLGQETEQRPKVRGYPSSGVKDAFSFLAADVVGTENVVGALSEGAERARRKS
jgi:hypothetical protein